MSSTQHYKFIDGTFSGKDAAQVLLSLVQSKIDFHSIEQWSNQERFGRDTAHSERRMAELRALREALAAVCRSAAETGRRVVVNGWLEIKLEPDSATTQQSADKVLETVQEPK